MLTEHPEFVGPSNCPSPVFHAFASELHCVPQPGEPQLAPLAASHVPPVHTPLPHSFPVVQA